jgi:hypothetical protein
LVQRPGDLDERPQVLRRLAPVGYRSLIERGPLGGACLELDLDATHLEPVPRPQLGPVDRHAAQPHRVLGTLVDQGERAVLTPLDAAVATGHEPIFEDEVTVPTPPDDDDVEVELVRRDLAVAVNQELERVGVGHACGIWPS